MTDPKSPDWLTIRPTAKTESAPAIAVSPLAGVPGGLTVTAWLPVEGDDLPAAERAVRGLVVLAIGQANLASFASHPLADRVLFADDVTRAGKLVGISLALHVRPCLGLPPMRATYLVHVGARHLRSQAITWEAPGT